MRFRFLTATAALVIAVLILVATPGAQRAGMFQGSADDPNIQYSSGPLDNVIDRLNAQLDAGTVSLTFEGRGGYLASALKAIGLAADSQMLVFSKGSLQGRRISQQNPRAIYFNDVAAVGFVRNGDALEVAVQDANRGVVFYTLAQKPAERPRFKREMICLGCHMTGDTHGVPGLLMFSTVPETDKSFGSIVFTRHTMPLAKRYGGWLVTGAAPPGSHLGNGLEVLGDAPSAVLPSTEGLYDQEGYLSTKSDVAALLVFAHQAGMVDLLVRASWEARMASAHADGPSAALSMPVLKAVADDVVDSLLFLGEARLDGQARGSSGFTERFEAQGPADARGRSLRQLDLKTRLLKYPCSYLIYSPLFEGLPPVMKNLIYRRLWHVLSGAEKDPRYKAALTLADRQAIVEILMATKPDLPGFFKPVKS